MSSPNPPFDLHVELFVNGAWTDVSGDVYDRNPIAITRGYSSETSVRVDPARCNLTLDNRARNYSPRNPNSIYYGTLKRNTPVRVSVNTGGTQYRFWGEIAGITPSSDLSGKDLTSTIEAGGLLRRLGQGQGPVRSTPRTYLPIASPLPVAYWPLEDGPRSTQGAPVLGTAPFIHLGPTPQNWGAGKVADWLAPGLEGKVRLASSNDAQFLATVPISGACTRWDVAFLVNGRADFSLAVNSGTDPFGTDAWSVSITPSANTLFVVAPAGTSGAGAPISFAYDGGYHHIQFSALENSIGDANFYVFIDGILLHTGNVTGSGASGPVLIAPLTLRFDLNAGADNTTGASIQQVAYWYNTGAPSLTPSSTYLNIMRDSRAGELAGDRIVRLCAENSIALTTIGTLGITQACGPQSLGTLPDLLNETAMVGGGLLYETMGAVGLTYQTRDSIYNEAVTLPLTYTTNHHLGDSLTPVDDDQTLRNDVTVTRKSGSPVQVTQAVGPLSISAPPTGVGRYTDSLTINCLTQDQALDQAGWRALNVGTWDEARYPALKFDLRVLPLAQRAQLLACNVGSRLTITSPPAWLPSDQIDLLIVGLKETLTRYQWDITLVCVPFGPYRVAVADSTTLARPSSDGSTVTTTTGSTSWSVATPSGPLWTTAAADFPFDLRCEGERVTVTNITGAASSQTFTVTRSVNGIVKAHTTAAVDPWFPMIAAM